MIDTYADHFHIKAHVSEEPKLVCMCENKGTGAIYLLCDR